MLSLHHLIVHQIEKSPEATDATLFLSADTLERSERTADLLQSLHRTFEQKSDRLQGRLAGPEDALFPGYLLQWRNAGMSRTALIELSRHTMQALELSMQGVVGAKGGYVVYADYQAETARYLGIFLVRDAEGVVFRRAEDGEGFAVESTTYLNTDKLALAARLRIDRIDDPQARYVELIKHNKSQGAISDYFVEWVGLEETTTSRAQTEVFLQMVDELPLPVDMETGQPLPEDEFQGLVMNFAAKNPQKVLSLKEFDRTFYGEGKPAQQYVADNDLPLDDEFRLDRGAMNRFYNHKAAADGLSLLFNRGHVRQGLLRIEGDTIVLFSPELVEQVRDLLEE